MRAVLILAARYGRSVLVAGLLAGLTLPGLALAMRPYLPELVILLLFVAALRIGPREAAGRLRDLGHSSLLVLIFQILIPIPVIIVFTLFGISGPSAAAIILLCSAPSISGSPNLTLMTGNDPAPAMRMLIVGTALLPLTVIPVFWLSPLFGSAAAVARASLNLLALIAIASGIAFVLRSIFFPRPSIDTLRAFDGLSAITLAIVVIGLMSAVRPALDKDPAFVGSTLAAAFAANFGLQIGAWFVLRAIGIRRERAAYSIVCGNRNFALFLAALPVAMTDPLLLFIGCYQIPMYLTPLLLSRLYSPPGEQQ